MSVSKNRYFTHLARTPSISLPLVVMVRREKTWLAWSITAFTVYSLGLSDNFNCVKLHQIVVAKRPSKSWQENKHLSSPGRSEKA